MYLERNIRPTLSAVELDHGDVLEVVLLNGRSVKLKLLNTGAIILNSTLEKPGIGQYKGRTNYKFHCDLEINGSSLRIEREVSSQRSFYQPLVVDGLRLWFDAADVIFSFLKERHGECRPCQAARFAFQDASLSIAPVKLRPWCPLLPGGLKIEDCYNGEDCWLGAYRGIDAHGGLDINHRAGTPLYAPFDIEEQFCYQRVEHGDYNNRWWGFHRWEDGTQWWLMTSHMLKMTVPDHQQIKAGEQYAEGAGVAVHAPGSHEHTHFAFTIMDNHQMIRLDPWILFQQMYLDNPTDGK